MFSIFRFSIRRASLHEISQILITSLKDIFMKGTSTTIFLANIVMPLDPHSSLEALHPSLWRASQLARCAGDYVDCGHPQLAQELPGGGWPAGALIELLIDHVGTAELQLLQSALHAQERGQIVFLQTPYQPHACSLLQAGFSRQRLLWLRSQKLNDALWTAEQVLSSANCAALLFWQNQVKAESLRRLHLAAQHGRTLFYLMRSSRFKDHPSPAILRIHLQVVQQGLSLSFIKRRGVQKHEAIILPMSLPPAISMRSSIESDVRHTENAAARVGRDSFAALATRRLLPSLVS